MNLFYFTSIFALIQLSGVSSSILKFHPSSILERIGEVMGQVLGQGGAAEGEDVHAWPPAFCNGLDCPKYTVLETGEGYVKRSYEANNFVGTEASDVDIPRNSMFMKLFRYIQGANEEKKKIDMTVPVVTRIKPGQGAACASNFTMYFFLPAHIGTPPTPTEPTVAIHRLAEQVYYVKQFSGYASKKDWLNAARQLGEDLDKQAKSYEKAYYFTAGYDAPFKLFNRHNEIWFAATD